MAASDAAGSEEYDEEPLGEYTRRKMKVQLGDGPDQRGEVTVEMVRANAEGFADWYTETERATNTLRERLGLDGDE